MTDRDARRGGELALTGDQTTFTPTQRAALAHMGVADAPEADLAVFAYVAQRAGLDPFARQIHMIGRPSKVRGRDGSDRWETKWTIQTGIDGFRVIARRAADRSGSTYSMDDPEWCHEDGSWRPVWSKAWGYPLAARVRVRRVRDGVESRFPAVALFDEYAQLTKSGGLTSMWAQRPAGQLLKCAEALALREAFPADYAGVLLDDEMHQADNAPARAVEAPSPSSAVSAATFAAPARVDVATGEVVDGEVAPDGGDGKAARAAALDDMLAAFRTAGFTSDPSTDIGRSQRCEYMTRVLGRDVSATADLSDSDIGTVTDALDQDAVALGVTMDGADQ